MKQFVFSMKALYDVQESIEKQVKLQMASIEAELIIHIRELETLNLNLEKTTNEYTGIVSRGVLAMNIKNYGVFFEKLRAVILIQQSKISQLEGEKAKCLQKLVEVRKEKRLLEKLREEQFAEYMDGIKKNQAKLIDDFVSHKAGTSS